MFCFGCICLSVLHFLICFSTGKTSHPAFFANFFTHDLIDQFTQVSLQSGFSPHRVTEPAPSKSANDFLIAESAAGVHCLTMLATLFFREMLTLLQYLRYTLSWLSCCFQGGFFIILIFSNLCLTIGIPWVYSLTILMHKLWASPKAPRASVTIFVWMTPSLPLIWIPTLSFRSEFPIDFKLS